MARYSDELIEDVKNSNDIVDVISQYVILKRRGRNFLGLCPFHKEKTPSFSVSPDKQIFHCFGCGVGGNVISFLSKIENIDFKETLELLAEKAGINLPILNENGDKEKQILKDKVYEINEKAAMFYHESLYKPEAKLAQEYVKNRKFDNRTLKSFRIGFAQGNNLYKFLKEQGYTDKEIEASCLVSKTNFGYVDKFKNRLMFPICDVRNRVIAFGGRVLDNSLPKYINSPENIVYSKGRNLFGLNVAKNSNLQKIIIVEGYMDAISLHQRGITNVVASLGTALTEAQGRLLRKYAEQIIISYDSDGAGQAATLRGLEILTNLGCDVRILQMEGAKDPDEFVIKYGTGRFNMLVDNAISLIEFKAKVLKGKLNLENSIDKVKFLKEIAKLLGNIESKIEQEVYIKKLAKEHNISEEAIYAEINKNYGKTSAKILDTNKAIVKMIKKENTDDILIKRENTIISLLISGKEEVYKKIKNKISPQDLKSDINKKILTKLYEELEKGNSNISTVVEFFNKDEQIVSRLTEIMADDYETENDNKVAENIISIYIKEKLKAQKNEIISKMNDIELTKEQKEELEKELHEVIIKIAQTK